MNISAGCPLGPRVRTGSPAYLKSSLTRLDKRSFASRGDPISYPKYGICQPKCTNAGISCPSGTTCNTGTGMCT